MYPCKPQFYYIKVGFKGVKLYRRVFVMILRFKIYVIDKKEMMFKTETEMFTFSYAYATIKHKSDAEFVFFFFFFFFCIQGSVP